MMAFVFERCGSMCSPLRAFAFALGLAALTLPGAASAADITVTLDEAKILKLPTGVATLVIGNPLIADASVQTGGLMVVTGKGYGSTNVIALDRTGKVLIEQTVEVRGPGPNVVVVFRGALRESYSCTPSCERRITLGDSESFFDETIGQTGSRNGLAQGNAPAAAPSK